MSGFLSIIFGACVSAMSTGSVELNERYGGDAYTGIQNAAAQTANNVRQLTGVVRAGISWSLIVFGIAMIAYFGFKCFQTIEKG